MSESTEGGIKDKDKEQIQNAHMEPTSETGPPSDSPPTSSSTSSSSPSSSLLLPPSLATLSSAFDLSRDTSACHDQLLGLFDSCLQRLVSLRESERHLSGSAGQLLKALQSEETLINQLSATLKRIRHEHKKLLARIANPRWEIRHHYHMTCLEHSLGHRQPHVMDVAEMLPGHLRFYALARTHALLKRTLTHSTQRAKGERNASADQIKEAYRQLREVRELIKDVQKMLETIQTRVHLLPPEERAKLEQLIKNHRKALAAVGSSAQRPGAGGSGNSQRMRYLKSLNLAPRMFDQASASKSDQQMQEEKQRTMATYNQDWKSMNNILNNLQAQSSQDAAGSAADKEKADEQQRQLKKMMQEKRKRIGLENIPNPIKFDRPGRAADSPTSAGSGASDTDGNDTETENEIDTENEADGEGEDSPLSVPKSVVDSVNVSDVEDEASLLGELRLSSSPKSPSPTVPHHTSSLSSSASAPSSLSSSSQGQVKDKE